MFWAQLINGQFQATFLKSGPTMTIPYYHQRCWHMLTFFWRCLGSPSNIHQHSTLHPPKKCFVALFGVNLGTHLTLETCPTSPHPGSSPGFDSSVLTVTRRDAATDVSEPRRLVELRVDGMTCAACSGAVERALRNLPGVLDVQVGWDLRMVWDLFYHVLSHGVFVCLILLVSEDWGHKSESGVHQCFYSGSFRRWRPWFRRFHAGIRSRNTGEASENSVAPFWGW